MPAKRLFTIALALLLGVSFATPRDARAAEFEDGGLRYLTVNAAARVMGCVDTCPDDLVIPNTAGGYPITNIANSAFLGSSVQTVVIGNSVTEIQDQAFYGTPLTSVTFGTAVQIIGFYAFANTKLTSVSIPDSVTRIGDSSFAGCLLTSVTLGNAITTIEESAFADNRITSVTFPNSVTAILPQAFKNNLITSVTLPNSLTKIDHGVFMNNLLTSVTIPNTVTSIGQFSFWNNKLKNVTIANGVTSIGVEAFAGNPLTSLTIGNSVTTIGGGAFKQTSLTTLTIPSSVTTIGNGAFMEGILNSVVIGSGVTSIGEYAFASNSLTSAAFLGHAPTAGAAVFGGNNDLTSVTRFNSKTGWSSTWSGKDVVIAIAVTEKPYMSGTVAVGNTLSANPGTWDAPTTSTFAYQWYACTAAIATETQAVPATCSAINSATQSAFTVTAAESGKFIAVGVTASSAGATSATWLSTTVAKAPPVNTVAPAVTGMASVFSTLTASSGTWTGYPTPTVAYQWLRCTAAGAAANTLPAGCTTIAGATQATYAIDIPDYQKFLRVQVTATNTVGSATRYTAATAKIAGRITVNTVAPTVTGSPTINATLTGAKGTWTGAPVPTYTYQWLRCTRAGSASDALPAGCSTISGATRTTYKLTTTEYGTYLRLKVVGTNSLGADTKYSAATAKIAGIDPVNTVAPRITGTPRVGSAASSTPGTWKGFPTPTISYQWFRCTSAGSASTAQPGGCTAISRATGSTYTLADADKTAGYLRLRVTGSSAEGRAVRFSAAVKVQ